MKTQYPTENMNKQQKIDYLESLLEFEENHRLELQKIKEQENKDEDKELTSARRRWFNNEIDNTENKIQEIEEKITQIKGDE